jgi:serine protease Do
VAVSQETPGTKIALGILRNGKAMNLDLTVGQYRGNGELASAAEGANGPQSGKLGLGVSDLTPDARKQLDVPAQVQGALVQSVRPASAADDAGLQPGDVILEVNRHSTPSADQFASQVHGSAAGKDMLLLVWSKGNASYRTIHPEQDGGNG